MNPRLTKLPVLVISAHSRCNCRCGMCDIWRTTESAQFSIDDLRRHWSDVRTLGVEWVVFTGGEPLLNADIYPMAAMLREAGVRVTVLTTGLLLRRFAHEIATNVDDVIVSLDGPRAVHDRIRGVLGAFDQLAAGVNAVRAIAPDFPIAARCTVQRANHDAIVATAEAARALGLRSISYLAVDVSSAAFNHDAAAYARLSASLLLTRAEIAMLDREFRALHAGPLAPIVAENPAKLDRIVAYFRAMAERRDPRAPRCNAPWVSAVLDQNGDVRPCFFHAPVGNVRESSLAEVLNSDAAVEFRRNLDVRTHPICRRCVCSLYRPQSIPLEATA